MRRWAWLVLAAGCAGSNAAHEVREPAANASPVPCEHATDVRVRGECLDPTGERDAAPALQRVVSAMPEEAPGLGTPLRLPENALLRLEDADGDGVAWRIDRRVILHGEGAVLKVVGDVAGVRMTRLARRSVVRDLTLEGVNRREGLGLDVRAWGVRIDNLWVRRIQTAIRAHSRIEATGTCASDDDCDCPDGICECHEGLCTSRANVNYQRWTNVLVTRCETAVTLRGGDANAGLFTGFTITGTPNAIVDESFLGNTYIGPGLAGTAEHSYSFLSDASMTTVVGGYLERGSAVPQTQNNTLFVGGLAATRATGRGERVGNHNTRLFFRDPESRLEVRIPGNADSVLAWEHPSEGARWRLQRFGDGEQMQWGFSHGGRRDRTFFFTEQLMPVLRQWRSEHPDAPRQAR